MIEKSAESRSPKRKRVRKPKGSWTHSTHDILGGKAVITRTKAGGDNWQFRTWIADEGKYVRKSLKTKDFDTAVSLAETEYFKLMSDVATGRKIFGVTLKELTEIYVAKRQEDVDLGLITKGRLTTIKSQIKHFLAYKPDLEKVSELNRNSYFDYANWRLKTVSGTKQVTIRNEQSTFNAIMDFGYREGYSHIPRLDFRPISIKKKDIGKRDIFTLEEYGRLYEFLRKYTSKQSCPNDEEREERLLIRDCILIASNTMLRVGELWNLKWRDIEKIERVEDELGKQLTLVYLQVRGEISKTRNPRRVVSRGGEYFKRLKSRSPEADRTDFIFTEVNSPKKLGRKKYYLHWQRLMLGIGIEDYQERQLTWYSLRHFGITCRLRAHVPIADIAQVAGTSVTHIENHYGQYDDDMLKNSALKNFEVTKHGIAIGEL